MDIPILCVLSSCDCYSIELLQQQQQQMAILADLGCFFPLWTKDPQLQFLTENRGHEWAEQRVRMNRVPSIYLVRASAKNRIEINSLNFIKFSIGNRIFSFHFVWIHSWPVHFFGLYFIVAPFVDVVVGGTNWRNCHLFSTEFFLAFRIFILNVCAALSLSVCVFVHVVTEIKRGVHSL